MYKITKYYATKSDCYNENIRLGKAAGVNTSKTFQQRGPQGMIIHSTGANNPYLKRYVGPDDGKLGKNLYNNHWNQPRSRRVMCHAFIGKLACGDIATYQVLPWNFRGWHGGSGKNGCINDTHASVEICEDNTNNKAYCLEVYEEAAQMTAAFFRLYPHLKITPLTLRDHKEAAAAGLASNHGDIGHWWPKHGKNMNTFRKRVQEILDGDKKDQSYTIRLEKGTPIYKTSAAKQQVSTIEITTNYTIVEEDGYYGKLKSGAGWVAVKAIPKPEPPKPEPPKPPTKGIPTDILTWADKNQLKLGAKGTVVGILQSILKLEGLYTKILDNDYGSVTVAAVREYQRKYKLYVDGIVGKQTWENIFSKWL